LHRLPELAALVVALHPDDRHWPALQVSPGTFAKLETVIGGEERVHSVRRALAALDGRAGPLDWVLVHDAVRPCVANSDIRRLMTALGDAPAGGRRAVPVGETVKRAGADGSVEATLDRRRLWLAATPQMFRYGVLLEAIDAALARGVTVTDEAAAVEALG